MTTEELLWMLRNNCGVSQAAVSAAHRAADRIEELEAENKQLREMLGLLVFCEEAEFYPSAIEKGSPYCIDFAQWQEDAIKLLTGGKDGC